LLICLNTLRVPFISKPVTHPISLTDHTVQLLH
jgi:hypothetical protein